MLIYKKLDKKDITEEQFKQIMSVENSTGTGYSEEVMRQIWIEDDNFVCIDKDKIVAHASYNPKSKRRNGSIYMVNLTVLPEYRRRGIAQNLIYTACKYYMDKGVKLLMSTSVDKDNKPAINLYQKVGFKIKTPICEADKDDTQYILDSTLNNVATILNNLLNSNQKSNTKQ